MHDVLDKLNGWFTGGLAAVVVASMTGTARSLFKMRKDIDTTMQTNETQGADIEELKETLHGRCNRLEDKIDTHNTNITTLITDMASRLPAKRD